jgi:hypothetical protein
MNEVTFTIKKGFIATRTLELIINNDFISFDNLIPGTKTVIRKADIAGYRFGMKWIELDLAFGREYFIFIQDKYNRSHKINFRTYFGRKIKFHDEQYFSITEALWNFYFDAIVTSYLDKYDSGYEFEIGNVKFSKEGITIRTSKAFSFGSAIIPWEDIRTRSYYSNFSIYSVKDPANINAGYSYANDWNTTVLYSVVRTILRDTNIESYN